MPRIIPIKDLRDTTRLSELCNSTNEPVYVTKNGYGDMVVMSMSAYEEYLEAYELYKKISFGIKQADEGKTIIGETVLKRLSEKYGM